MSRDLIACPVQDLSAFAKSLRAQLKAHLEKTPLDGPPGHLSLMNMLARAAGHRNVQALKAAQPRLQSAAGGVGVEASPPSPANRAHLPARQRMSPRRGPAAAGLSELADRALRQFDDDGRLARWPTKYSVQRVALWGLWMRFDSKRPYTEREVNTILRRWHAFGDHCTLRRELINMKLLERTPDGAVYRKCGARPDEAPRALMHALRQQPGGPFRSPDAMP